MSDKAKKILRWKRGLKIFQRADFKLVYLYSLMIVLVSS